MRDAAEEDIALPPPEQFVPAPMALAEWARQGLCAQADPETFFPPKGHPDTEARQICGQCPVRAVCLAYAIEADEKFGIWGGMNRTERLRVRDACHARKAASATSAGAA